MKMVAISVKRGGVENDRYFNHFSLTEIAVISKTCFKADQGPPLCLSPRYFIPKKGPSNC